MGSRSDKHCPVAATLSVVGEKWSLHIVRDLLLDGPRRFQDLLESLDGVGPNTLSVRLKTLEDEGVVERRVYSERPIRAAYQLTRKGQELAPVIGALRDWGKRNTKARG